jgi:hypothetical protein
MTQDDGVTRAEDAVIADLARHVGEFVAVVACVQVRTADPATQHVQEQLPLLRHGVGQFLYA